MKPRNFVGRRHARKQRANARANHTIAPVADICWRHGAEQRDPVTGIARTTEAS